MYHHIGRQNANRSDGGLTQVEILYGSAAPSPTDESEADASESDASEAEANSPPSEDVMNALERGTSEENVNVSSANPF